MRFSLSILLFCVPLTATAQSMDADLRRDWYAVVPTIDMSVLDTIVLQPVNGNFDQHKDIFLWRYLGGNNYQLKIYNNTMPGAYDNYELVPERWRLKQEDNNEYYLVVKEKKDPRPFHKKVAGYRLITRRDDYNILRSITLVKIYGNRYTEQLKTPSFRN